MTFFYGTSSTNGGSYEYLSSSTALTLNAWNHVAIVRDLTNSTFTWYINGSQTATAATAGTLPLYIGAGYVNNYAGSVGFPFLVRF